MFNHVMVGATDIDRAKTFYDAVLGVLGANPPAMDRNGLGRRRLFYIHAGGIFCVSEPLDGKAASGANGGTIGFKCESPRQVACFFEAALANGGKQVEDPPGRRDNIFGGPMHLAYVLDPDGNKLCAVFRYQD